MLTIPVPASVELPPSALPRLQSGIVPGPPKPLDNLAPPAERLLDDATQFDFFQAVWLLERMAPHRRSVGREGDPRNEVVRFRAHQSLSFPPSSIFDLEAANDGMPPRMTVTFMGLTGSSGVLPRHYTELLLRVERESKAAQRYALRDWLDLFNHRLISLFFRAWEKYRFYVAQSRFGSQSEPDAFTDALWSLIGIGQPSLRNRLRVKAWQEDGETDRTVAGVSDLGLLRYAGILARRPRTAVNLEQTLVDFFSVPVRVKQFQGQWLALEPAHQTRLGQAPANGKLGVSAVVGQHVWDVQGKICLQLGPLTYDQFLEFLPDRCDAPQRKAQFLLAHLVRFYVGPETDFDVQLILRAADVPACRLVSQRDYEPRLGWNTWLISSGAKADAADAVFAGHDLRTL